MKTVVIENPILNSPFETPKRHFKFDEDGITDETADTRRPSSYFIPIAEPEEEGQAADPRPRVDPGPRPRKRRRQPHPQPGRPLAQTRAIRTSRR